MNSTLQHTLGAKSNANKSFTVSIIFRLYPQYDAPIQQCEPAAADTRLQLHCQLLLVALDVGTHNKSGKNMSYLTRVTRWRNKKNKLEIIQLLDFLKHALIIQT